MFEDILNQVYDSSLEFGDNWRRPIIEITKALFPTLPSEEQISISQYIEQTRKEIEDYFYSRYNYKNDNANKKLQTEGYEWIKKKYSWMCENNIRHAISQAMYYAWHG